ncbi:(2Fe-2S)-binding protein [Comamonadaceae bacterium G21597-S1]|nr:(2Fe-2S)-binding protein [Comamonadaceae bacterium G21597-S1]
MQITVNRQPHTVPVPWQQETLLHVLRESFGLVGSKFGCGMAQCGACTVWLDGAPVRSCVTPVAAVGARAVTTIEGLAPSGEALHPVQRAWLAHQVPQCGYCQAGQIMAAAALLRDTPVPTDAQIDAAMAGHLCRCGTQHRVRAAIRSLAAPGAAS